VDEAVGDALILKVRDGQVHETLDLVASERTVTLYINDEALVSLLCSPLELDSLAVGFLISEGILTSRDNLVSVKVQGESVFASLKNMTVDRNDLLLRKAISSGCGQGVTFSDTGTLRKLPPVSRRLSLPLKVIRGLLRDFVKISTLYRKTGGVHSAVLADSDGRILLSSEDIGRHNAVDKLLGKAFLQNIPVEDKLILSSGRVSGEIMTKIIRSRMPVLISRAAPTCMSVSAAEDHGVTLIGFARGDRMNIYAHPWRIELEDYLSGGLR